MTVRTQTRYPTTVVSDDAVGTLAWSDPDKAEVEDNDPATATGPGTTEYLLASGYGFNLPSTASPLTATPKPRRKGGGLPTAWTVIGSQTLESAAASVSFTGISTTYRMFRVTAYIVKDGNAGGVNVRLNNDDGGNYDRQRMIGGSTTVSANRATGQTSFSDDSTAANTATTQTIQVAKQLAAAPAMLLRESTYLLGGDVAVQRAADVWDNTADLISRIDLIASAGNFAAGTVVVLEAM